MASFFVKNEPIDHHSDISDHIKPKSHLDKQIEAEAYYLNKVNQGILNGDESCEELAEFRFTDVPYYEEPTQDTQNKRNEKLVMEKKQILAALNEQIKQEKDFLAKMNSYESLSVPDEVKLLDTLDAFINSEKNDSLDQKVLICLRRFRAKLDMRKLKRKNYLKLFNLDAYVNELIDREKYSILSSVKKEHGHSPRKSVFYNFPLDDEDIIFQGVTLKTCENDTKSGCEIIELVRVLDRFNNRKFNLNPNGELSTNSRTGHLYSPIGVIESRNEDIKCLISPFTKKILKPYVRRDYESLPLKLNLNREIANRSISLSELERASIDYVHLRPEHVLHINLMCRQHFWPGIDITECLEYPDYTIVALYRKLIVGFAFLVPPNSTYKEAYLSFIFVHPDWRNARLFEEPVNGRCDVSIAQYMLFYLIKSSPTSNISLHVSVNSPAIVFYQKFGFKIEEYIKNFYDKYYSDEHGLSKDAFQMKLYCH